MMKKMKLEWVGAQTSSQRAMNTLFAGMIGIVGTEKEKMKLIDSEKLFDVIYYRYVKTGDNRIKGELAYILAIIQRMPMYNENTKKVESLPSVCSMPINNYGCSITIDDDSVKPISLGAIMKQDR